jgi:hypothetical protein
MKQALGVSTCDLPLAIRTTAFPVLQTSSRSPPALETPLGSFVPGGQVAPSSAPTVDAPANKNAETKTTTRDRWAVFS